MKFYVVHVLEFKILGYKAGYSVAMGWASGLSKSLWTLSYQFNGLGPIIHFGAILEQEHPTLYSTHTHSNNYI